MAMSITPYLFFGGRAAEAMEFYKQHLSAELQMSMRFNESPEPMPEGCIPDGFEDKVMHAAINVQGQTLFISDGSGYGQSHDGYSLALSVDDEPSANRIFSGLSDGGEVLMPIQKTFWSPAYGMLKDRFGINWMVMVPGETSSTDEPD